MWYDRDVPASSMVMIILQYIDVYYQYIAQLNLYNVVCISIICKIKNKKHTKFCHHIYQSSIDGQL